MTKLCYNNTMALLSRVPQQIDVSNMSRRFEGAAPQEILRWTVDTFAPDVILTCSFQHEGVALAHMLLDIAPQTPVVFIDTGFHFPETLAYKDTLTQRYGFRVVELSSLLSREEFVRQYGLDLYRRNPDLCCRLNKVEPLQRALKGVRAWINGRRRDQGVTRQHLPIIEEHGGGLMKINPLATWTSRDTYNYLKSHDIPFHPLFEKGYASIGCAPCTRPILPGEDERAGRWPGQEKTECGLHTFPPDKS